MAGLLKRMLLALAAALALGACGPTLIPAGYMAASRPNIGEGLPSFIVEGKTTRDELLMRMGEPDERGHFDRWFAVVHFAAHRGMQPSRQAYRRTRQLFTVVRHELARIATSAFLARTPLRWLDTFFAHKPLDRLTHRVPTKALAQAQFALHSVLVS